MILNLFTSKLLKSIKNFYIPIFVICYLLFVICFPVNVSAATYSMTKTGLVSYFPLDEGGSTVAHDMSGNVKNGTLQSSPLWVSGRMGKALSFNGSNQYVLASSNLGISGDANFTMCAWIKWTGSSWSADYPSFMGNNSTGVTNQGLSFTVNGGRPAIDFWNNRFRASNALNVNTWYHVCGTKSAGIISTNSKLYINGILVSGAVEGSDVSPNIADSPSVLGRLDGTRWFQGLVDEARFYNRVLSASEIASVYKEGISTVVGQKGLVGYWPLNENTGTKANDMSGNLNTSSLTNTTWVTGKFGSALQFNGSNAYSIATGNSLIFGSGNFTVNMWVYPTTFATEAGLYDTLSIGGAGIRFNDFILVQNASTGKLRIFTSNGYTSSTNNSLTLNKWNYVSIVRSGTTVTFYLNGVADSVTVTMATNLTSGNAVVGRYSDVSSGWFTGKIDEIKSYNRALSAPEIMDLYLSRSGSGTMNVSPVSVSSPLSSGLVGLWTFDGKDMTWGSNLALDRSGSGSNGTISGSPLATIGKIGQALDFNGSSSYIDIPNYYNLSPATLSLWFNSRDWSAFPILISKNAGGASGYIQYYSGQLSFYASGNILTTNWGSPSLNKWHHLVLVVTGSQHLAYLDGALVGSPASSALALFTGSYDVQLGRYHTGSYYFNGKMDDVRIYNRVLSASEVKSLYNSGL